MFEIYYMETKTRKLALIGLWNIWCIRHLQSDSHGKGMQLSSKNFVPPGIFLYYEFLSFCRNIKESWLTTENLNMLLRQHRAAMAQKRGKEIEWLSMIIIVCIAPVALCTAKSLNEISLSMGLRVWCDHTDNQKGAPLFIYLFWKSFFLFSIVSQLVVASPWLKEMHEPYINDQHPK